MTFKVKVSDYSGEDLSKYTLRQYECIKDYHPLLSDKPMYFLNNDADEKTKEEVRIHNASIKKVPTKEPIVKKGDILTQMGKNDSRYKSKNNKSLALYEYTIKEYKDCFKRIR